VLTLWAWQPECLWDEALPIEVRELPDDLAALDRLLGEPAMLGPIVERFRREVIEDRRLVLTDGRPTIAMETYVRLMVLKAAAQLEELADRCEKAAGQIKQRVAGEPFTDRLVSLSAMCGGSRPESFKTLRTPAGACAEGKRGSLSPCDQVRPQTRVAISATTSATKNAARTAGQKAVTQTFRPSFGSGLAGVSAAAGQQAPGYSLRRSRVGSGIPSRAT
jgi:hypothetical protein